MQQAQIQIGSRRLSLGRRPYLLQTHFGVSRPHRMVLMARVASRGSLCVPPAVYLFIAGLLKNFSRRIRTRIHMHTRRSMSQGQRYLKEGREALQFSHFTYLSRAIGIFPSLGIPNRLPCEWRCQSNRCVSLFSWAFLAASHVLL